MARTPLARMISITGGLAMAGLLSGLLIEADAAQLGRGYLGPLVGAMLGLATRDRAVVLALAGIGTLVDLGYGVAHRALAKGPDADAFIVTMFEAGMIGAATRLVPPEVRDHRSAANQVWAGVIGILACMTALGCALTLTWGIDQTPLVTGSKRTCVLIGAVLLLAIVGLESVRRIRAAYHFWQQPLNDVGDLIVAGLVAFLVSRPVEKSPPFAG